MTADVIGEAAILQWYKTSHSSKGKSVFLDQLKPMINWLENAEEGQYTESLSCACTCMLFSYSMLCPARVHTMLTARH